MKTLVRTLIFVFTFCAASQLVAQEASREKANPIMVVKIENSDLEFRVEAGNDQLNDIDVNLIRSVNVFKGDSAVAKYGIKAKHGAVVLLLKENALKELPEKYRKLLAKSMSGKT